jgi:hypothetical protein
MAKETFIPDKWGYKLFQTLYISMEYLKKLKI